MERKRIVLSDERPIAIIPSEWPTIAKASLAWSDRPEMPIQASRSASAWIRVRRHADGRTLVYGQGEYDSRWQGESGAHNTAGYLRTGLTEPNLLDLISEVAHEVCEGLPLEDSAGRIARSCVASMEAREV